MYLPYFRGKRHELRAIKRLLDSNLLSNYILPIIEPVNLPETITLLNRFTEEDRNIIVIHNTQATCNENNSTENNRIVLNNLFRNDNILIGHIINDNSDCELRELEQLGVNLHDVVYINPEFNINVTYEEYISNLHLESLVTTNENLLNNIELEDRAILRDNFNKLSRNADYQNIPDEYFSNDHLTYIRNGYNAFPDYSIIGNKYSDSGWAAYAMVIHIVYLNNDNSLRIRHFVSNTNNTNREQGQKFFEQQDNF